MAKYPHRSWQLSLRSVLVISFLLEVAIAPFQNLPEPGEKHRKVLTEIKPEHLPSQPLQIGRPPQPPD